MKMNIEKVVFPYTSSFAITGYTFDAANTVRVTLEEDGRHGRGETLVGRGESIGIYYEDETMDSMAAQLSLLQEQVTSGISRQTLQDLLPRGGARNALDCALWDLEAKRAGTSIWDLLDITPKPLTTVYTLGIDTPELMAKAARQAARFPNLKIKLSDDEPMARLEAIRGARPDAKLIVDINQGWSFEELKEYIPVAKRLDIAMIEQPLPRGGDEALEGFVSPVPLGADESCLDSAEYEVAAGRYDVINIKLDKCGGLTDALEIVRLARRDGKGLMVGNMGASSLSMAPGFVIGQCCQYVDLDGPLMLVKDIEGGMEYSEEGIVSVPKSSLWG